jgi:hypothetical protein
VERAEGVVGAMKRGYIMSMPNIDAAIDASNLSIALEHYNGSFIEAG